MFPDFPALKDFLTFRETALDGPPFAVIDPETLCIDPRSAEKLVTRATKAIIPVHIYGHPADMDALNEIASVHDLVLIEDAAEAHGAEHRGRRVGSLGRCGIFSFYGNKIITTGEGGAFTTSDRNLYLRAKSLRDHAMSPTRRYHHDECGFNYRMTNLQAALGVAQMDRIEEFLIKRAEIMSWYRSAVVTNESIRLNRVRDDVRNVYWMICLEVDWLDEARRDELMNELKGRGIDTRPYFRTMSSLPMYKQTPQPIADRKAQIGLNLPSYVELTQADVRRVAIAVNELLTKMRPNAAGGPARILSAVPPSPFSSARSNGPDTA